MNFKASPREWRLVSVEEIKADTPNALATGPFGSSIGPRFFETCGVPLIRGTNLSDDISVRLNHKNIAFISKEKSRDFERSKVRKGDLVFTSRGSVGQVGLIDKNCPYPEYVISNNMMKLSPDLTKVDSDYLYYLFSSPIMSDEIKNQTIGTSVPGFNLGQLRSIKILLPPLPEQRAIARILGSLDDKIEANRQMNETLETIARAIFKSWFVDFDPVRAKAEGREPVGMDAETAALFPDSLDEIEMVPKKWNVGSFDEIIEIIGGGTPKTSVAEYWNGNIPWFSIVDSPNDGDIFVIDTEKKITKRGIEESSTRVLPKGTTIITARGTVGKCALVGTPMTMNQSCYGIRGKNGRGGYFTYFALRNLVNELKQSTHGSVFDTITRETFRSVRSSIVPLELTQAFDEKVFSLMGKILANLHESRNLKNLRDSLMPKLLSGEIKMTNLREFTGERS